MEGKVVSCWGQNRWLRLDSNKTKFWGEIKMKSRYLFPLVYVVADAFSILFFPHMALLLSLSAPSGFVMRVVSKTLNAPTDPTYFGYVVGVGTILQMFLLGLLFELLLGARRKLFDRNCVAT